jgi:membrane-associated phospholipid phosphatase
MKHEDKPTTDILPIKPTTRISKATVLRLFAAFALFAVPIIIFAELADEILDGEKLPFDAAILLWLNSIATPFLDSFFIVVTNLGAALGIVILTLLGAGILYRRRYRRQAALLTFGVAGSAVINLGLKFLFERSRPDLWAHLVAEDSYSFPSGHAMGSGSLAFSLMAIFWPTKWRWHVVVIGSIYILLIGASRLYLGVHYPSDVLAGWCVSLVWVLIVKHLIDTFPYSKLARKPTAVE